MATTTTIDTDRDTETSPDDLKSLVSEQRRELMAAQSLESDLDLAFHLQLQEALAASLASHPSTSSPPLPRPPTPPPPPPSSSSPSPSQPKNDTVFTLADEEISRLEQEITDREFTRREMARIRLDLDRRIHDQNLAGEIAGMPEDEWSEWGDNYEKPFGEGCSKDNVHRDLDEIFRVYFKGLISEEKIGGNKTVLAGIGVAICDPKDNSIFEVRKPLIGNGMNKNAAEAKALIEGLNAALALGLKRVTFYCDYFPIYQFVTGRWLPRQRKIAVLVNQVSLLQRKFAYCNPVLMARNDIKYAFKFAKEAIVSQISRPAEPSRGKPPNETCVICLEDSDVWNMFSVDGCLHRYCFSCMRQHVEVKLLHGMVPNCPHEDCTSELNVDSCQKFLTPKLIEILNQRKKEASIPIAEKVYCPYPRCSALMSKSEVSEYAENLFVGAERSGARKCLKCHGLFCINCKVPWHSNMTCHVYKRLNPNPPAEDVKLKSLATRNLWRQCVKCNHLIELSEGCYHMTCRCGYEFCYNCGLEWKNKKATCSCPLWDEEHIWHNEDDSDFDEEEEEEFDEDEFYGY